MKIKIKIYNNRVYTNFQYKKIPNDNEYCTLFVCNIIRFYFVNSDKEYFQKYF